MSSSKHISFPKVEGKASRQAHADLPLGTFERELGRDGFFGPATQMYHAHPPTGWLRWEGPLRPRVFDTTKLLSDRPLPWAASPLLSNAHVSIHTWTCSAAMEHLIRNGDGDDLIFVHSGEGRLYCDYGHLAINRGDYIVIPRSTMWRLEPTTTLDLLLIECTGGAFKLPERGLIGPHAQFDEAMLDTPKIDARFQEQQVERREWQVHVKRRNIISTVTYPYNPLDAVGWHGNLSPVRLNIRDIRPLSSHRYHLPPSAHTTWVGQRFVVCTFVPRPFETDPGAIKVPFFHNNDDYDEVVFYHEGDFFSRDDIKQGMLSFHPSGCTHGPHPKALERIFDMPAKETLEYAVMIDARDALDVGTAAEEIELPEYADSWSNRDQEGQNSEF